MNIKSDINLEVTYNNELVLQNSNYDHSTFQLSIFGKKINKKTDCVTIEFNNFKELEDIVKDFKNKCKLLKIKL